MVALQKQTLVIRFGIRDELRFLSHRETVAMWQRALVRSDLQLAYSEGFNPHPKLSIGLARSVGVQSQEELLCVEVQGGVSNSGLEELKSRICEELPDGCEISSVEILPGKARFQPESMVYVFHVEECFSHKIETLKRILKAKEPIIVQRQGGKRSNRPVEKEIGRYIDSIECDGDELQIKCRIEPDGTIRVDELMEILGIERGDLTGPVERRSFEWVKQV